MKKNLLALFLLIGLAFHSDAQQYPCPYVNAGPDQVLPCGANCTNLSASFLPSGTTSTYRIDSISYAPFPYLRGVTPPSPFYTTDDEYSGAINIPFTFCFFGVPYTQCVIGNNGMISFNVAQYAGQYNPWSLTAAANIPSPMQQLNSIMGAYMDIIPGELPVADSNYVNYATVGVAPCRKFVVSYYQVPFYTTSSCPNDNLTSQIVLYETTNVIEIYIGSKPSCAAWNGGLAIEGIQNAAGTVAYPVAGRNRTIWTATNDGRRFLPTGPNDVTINWFQGGTHLASTDTVLVCPPNNRSTAYVATATYHTCNDSVVVRDTVFVNVLQSAGPTQYLSCPSPAASVTMNASGTGTWTAVPTNPAPTIIANPTSPNTVISSFTLPGTYQFEWSAGLCFDTTRVIVTQRADAGPDQNRCKFDTVMMAAYGTGTWTAFPTNPSTTNIFVPTQNNTRITGFSAGGAYSFVWTTSPGCSDTMVVNIPFFSIVLTAGSTSVCQYSNTTVTVTPSIAALSPFQYTWIDSTIVQSPHSATTSVNGLPGNTYFHVQVTSNDGCKLTDSILITTTALVGTNIHASANPTTVCPGNPAQLVVVANPNSCGAATSLCSAPGTTVSMGTSTTTFQTGPTFQYPCIYGNYYKSAHHQFLIHASELIGQVPSGGQIKSVSFDVRTLNGGSPLTNLTIRMACVGNDSMNDAFLALGSLTQVYTIASYAPVTGWNTHNFQTAYNWDGVSNVIVDVCFDNTTNNNINPKFFYTVTPFKSIWCTFGNDPSGECNIIGTQARAVLNSDLFQRPNMQFNMCITDLAGANLQWTPSTGPNAPTPTNLDTVIAHPVITTQYQVALTSANGCVNYDYVTVNVDTTVQLTVSPDTFTCTIAPMLVKAQTRVAGGGSINPATITYNWSTNPSTSAAPPSGTGPTYASATLTPTATTTYICTISGPGFCTITDSATVTLGNGLPVNKVVDSITCAGTSTGKIFVNMNAGTPPFRYTWSPAANNVDSIVNLAAGTYYLTVTDTIGCVGKDTVKLIAPSPLTLAFDSTNILCYNTNIDTIRARVAGGRQPYRYTWSPAANNTNQLTGLPAGNYQLTVTDTSGCTINGGVNITQPAQLISSATSTNLSGANTHDGTITTTTSGGTPGYTYSSTPSAPGLPNATGLDTGKYIITICDAHQCCVNDTAIITAPPPIVINFSVVNEKCHDSCTGKAFATVTGGVLPYTYVWNTVPVTAPLSTTDSAVNLCVGTYRFKITDAHGITMTQDTTITQPTAITQTITSTNVTCFGASNGTLHDLASGGTPGYTVTWTPGGADPLSGLAPGTYTALVTDANGCPATNSATITGPAQLTIDTTITASATCYGQSNGSATVVATGGTGAYTYAWSGSSSTGTSANDLAAGPQTVTVTDANGCTASISFTISQPAQLSVAISSTTASHCFTSNDGIARANVTGGTLPYTYSWDGTVATDTFAGLIPGAHSLSVTDAHGCTASTTFNIDTQYVLHISLTADSVTCNGGSNGVANVTANNGTPNYTYVWSPSTSTSPSATGLSAGIQNVTVTDLYGCAASGSIMVDQPNPITDNVYFADPLCASQQNGKVWLTAGGTVGPYTFTFNNGGTSHPITDTIFNLASTTYPIVITDGRGCTKADNVTLTDPAQLSVPVPTVIGISCANASNGSIQVLPIGGTLPYSYTWNPGSYTAAQENNLAPATYDITVTDANGCNVSVAVTLTAPPPISFTLIQSDSTSCPGSSDGHIVVNVVGGTPGNNVPYTYSRDGVNFYPNHNFYDLAAGTYHIFVTDSPGCTLDTFVTVYQPYPVTAAINPGDSLIQLGTSLQLYTVINNITTQTINSYTWTPSIGLSCIDCPNPLASPYQSTQYYLTVNYGKNCSTTTTNTIEVGHGPDTYIPNAFTPNGDGTNDRFEVFGSALQSVGMKIFNRWGEKVFDSGDSQWASWDGTYMGAMQPTGVYVYYVELVYLDGQKKMHQGSLSLIR